MASVVVIGAGLAGLATTLFLSRRGHKIALVDADPPPPAGGSAEANFWQWERKGVPQARQTHNFMGLSSAVLHRQAPDVLERLRVLGAGFCAYGLVDWDGTPAPMLFARRTTYEHALREAVEREPNVDILWSSHVEALAAAPGDPPHVTGVHMNGGRFVSADLVIDCAGRRSRVRSWLDRAGARALAEEVHPCGLMYFTRWYRLRRGEEFPDAQPPVFARMSYMNLFIAHGDSGTFSVTFTVSEADPYRRALRNPADFHRAAAAVPTAVEFLNRAEPESDPLPFGAIVNARRSLADEEGPIVRNYVLIGDSSIHTNPTLGRGVSLSFAEAEHLCAMLDRIDPADVTQAHQRWSQEALWIWFDSQVQVDSAYAIQCAAIANGRAPPDPPAVLRGQSALATAAAEDPQVEHAWRRVMNLVLRPDALRQDLAVAAALKAKLAAPPEAPGASDLLPRRSFEALF